MTSGDRPSVRNISTTALGLVTNDNYFNSLSESYMKLGTPTSEVLQQVPGTVMASAFREKANDSMHSLDAGSAIAFSSNSIQVPSIPDLSDDKSVGRA